MFAPRQDVVSDLMVYDLAEGTARRIASMDGRFEAPNWLPDGRGWLINGQGRLWHLEAQDPVPRPVDTGFAMRLNNDHEPSPDGRWLAISDKTETGKSVIYRVPWPGGAPLRVTPEPGSYFHGWSPDGGRLAYTALRDGRFAIATCALDGTDEQVLTDQSFAHCDGPDYTPDGRWIWFNGERDGAVDLWRVSPQGGRAERMTDGPQVDWFPHPSPDGAWVVYIAYEPGTLQHPPDVDIELRLMPAQGGASRRLYRLWGGQGTLNVPCWAPDGGRFAFMEYRPAKP